MYIQQPLGNHTLLHKNLMHSCFLRERIFKLVCVCIFLYLSALLLTFALYPRVDFFSRVNKGTLINPHDVWIKTLLISKYGGKKSEKIFPLDLNSISHESKCQGYRIAHVFINTFLGGCVPEVLGTVKCRSWEGPLYQV